MNRTDFAIANALDAANRITTFVDGVNKQEFLRNKMMVSAVTANIWLIQRSLKRIPEIGLPWSNVAPSERYYALEDESVWQAATIDVPQLILSLPSLESGASS